MAFRCNGFPQVLCTSWLVVALLIYAVATVLAHRAFGVLVPALTGLPTNVKRGLDSIVGFEHLEADAIAVKDSSKAGLAKCNIASPAAQCDSLGLPAMSNARDTSLEVGGIGSALDRTLIKIQKVAEDPYLGRPEFRSLGAEIRAVRASLAPLQNRRQPVDCSITNPAFCALYKNGDELLGGMGDVRSGIDKIADSSAMEEFKLISKHAKYLHALPYFAWLGLLFYMCLFAGKDGRWGCGSPFQCIASSCNGLFLFLFLVTSIAIGVGVVVVLKFSKEAQMSGFQDVSPADLVEHIQTTFPSLYDLVLKDLLGALMQVFKTLLIFIFAELMFAMHMMSACCCKVYAVKRSP